MYIKYKTSKQLELCFVLIYSGELYSEESLKMAQLNKAIY